jgi:thiol-disulfide isomerase/thioredoxin
MSERESPAVMTSLILLVLLLVGGAGAYYFSQKIEAPTEPGEPKKEHLGRIPDSWAFSDLEGKQTQLGDLRGKVVFINFWGTTCPPCIQEMPSIQALYESLKGSDVVFVILSAEAPERVRAFVKKQGWSLPIYVASERMPPVLATGFIPTTVLVNRRGEVVYRQIGGKDWNTEEVRALLKKVS